MGAPRIDIIDFDREAVEDARQLTVQQRLQLSGDLFDSACQVTLAGIKRENPGVSQAEALDILRRRLEWAERSETRV
jgi:hypothetical protein